jgi:hypothetical protein
MVQPELHNAVFYSIPADEQIHCFAKQTTQPTSTIAQGPQRAPSRIVDSTQKRTKSYTFIPMVRTFSVSMKYMSKEKMSNTKTFSASSRLISTPNDRIRTWFGGCAQATYKKQNMRGKNWAKTNRFPDAIGVYQA